MGYGDYERTRQILNEVMDDILEGKSFNGIKTGYDDLDRVISGLGNGELIVVGGRPAMGKTAFGLNLLEKIAVESGEPCLFFSIDLKAKDLFKRMLIQHSGISLLTPLDEKEVQKLKESEKNLEEAPIIIEDSLLELEEIVDRARKHVYRNGIRLMLVDYLQLITVQCGSFEEGISCIMKRLKELAQELQCPIILMSQLNRSVEHRNDHRPLLMDLRGSGSIENVADKVILLYRDEYYYVDSDIKGILEAIVAKNTSGRIGCAELAYIAKSGKMFSIER